MRTLLLNAFSLGMLGHADHAHLEVLRLSLEQARQWAEGAESYVGHATTAALFEAQLGIPVPVRREAVTLDEHSRTLVGQYIGPRLAEGATTLPEGAVIRWYGLKLLPPAGH